MFSIRRFLQRLVHTFRPERAESDLAREVASHLALIEDEYRRQGMSPQDAHTAARRSLGGAEQAKIRHRDARSFRWLDELFADVKQAWRTATRNRRSSAAAILILTTVGAVTALVFGIADAVLFRSLPYHDPDRVHVVRMAHETSEQRYTRVGNNVLQLFSEPRHGISQAGLIGAGPIITIETPDGPSRVSTASATPSYLEVLDVRPALGRLLSAQDVESGGHVALLAYNTWRTRFGGREDIVGHTVTLGNFTLDVVGILPSGFFLPVLGGTVPEVITAAPFPKADDEKAGAFHPVVRLSSGVTREQAQAALTTTAKTRRSAEDPTTIPVLDPVRSVLFPGGQVIMRWLVACTLALVVLACVNLAGLLLVRGFGRARETGVKLALGASRTRIVRPVVFEVIGMSVTGGLAAVLLARAAFEPVLAYVPRIAYSNAPVGIDLRVAIITVGLVAVTAVLATFASVWFSTKRDADRLIRSAGGGRASTSTWRRGRVLVAVQTALTVVLVFGAAITGRAFVALLNVPIGFDPENVVTMSIQAGAGETIPYQRIMQNLARRPDVVAVGAVGQRPFDGSMADEDAQTRDGTRFGGISHTLPGYFDAIRLPVVRGRSLRWNDYHDDPDIAVLSESAARALAPGGDVLGSTFTNGRGRTFRVVGVVADLRHSIESDFPPTVYAFPLERHRPFTLMARTTHRSEAMRQDLQQAVRDEAPGTRVGSGWYSDLIRNVTAFRNPRFQTIVLTTLSAVALVLTMVGIVGVLGCLVAARTREMAVRAAIGATPGSLVRLVIRQGLVPVLFGLVAGLIATRWAAGFAEAQLFAVDTTGVAALVMTAAVVLVAALVAAWIPSRRAGRIDPVVALKAE